MKIFSFTLLLISILIVLNGCSTRTSNSSFYYPQKIKLSGEKNTSIILKVKDPANKVVIIYTPGSNHNFKPTSCTPHNINSTYGIPNVINDLTKNKIDNKQVIIDGYCSIAIGKDTDEVSSSITKPQARAKDLIHRIQQYINMGVPAKQIFVSGQSIGGWSSLLVIKELFDQIGGVIAFAPAFSGHYATRNDFWTKLQKRENNYLKNTKSINGLVYIFNKDRYYKFDDLDFLNSIPNLELIKLSDEIMSKQSKSICINKYNRQMLGAKQYWHEHSSVYKECFRKSQKEKIQTFIEKSIQ